VTTWKWLRAMLEHEAHHRGQLYFTLGMLGVSTPPIYGLSEPELLARTARPNVESDAAAPDAAAEASARGPLRS
jgi:hypothetical protein